MAAYRCTACRKPFDGWGALRAHHAKCLRFMERLDGVRRTRASQGASASSGFTIHDSHKTRR